MSYTVEGDGFNHTAFARKLVNEGFAKTRKMETVFTTRKHESTADTAKIVKELAKEFVPQGGSMSIHVYLGEIRVRSIVDKTFTIEGRR